MLPVSTNFPMLNLNETKRYSRQIVLPEIGVLGQEAIKKSRVLCVGAGGLGSPALLYLAAAGVGTLGIIDPDQVDDSNLQRQILFGSSCLKSQKTSAARDRIHDLNPHVKVEVFPELLGANNALSILDRFDVVIDGTDNFAAKFLLNDATAKLEIPLIYGAISRFEGQISVFWKGRGPCYRCLYPQPPIAQIENCAEAGVLGALAGIIGSMQAMEAIKIILNNFKSDSTLKPLIGRLLLINAEQFQIDEFRIQIRPECQICHSDSDDILIKDIFVNDLDHPCDRPLPGRTAGDQRYVQTAVSQDQLESLLQSDLASCILIDVREKNEWDTGHIPGALHWPFSKLRSGQIPILHSDSPSLVLYCQTGMRSQQALKILAAHGINSAKQLEGGYQAWTN